MNDVQPATTIYFDALGRPLPMPFDIEQCSNGVVVPNPYDNSGLVRDCKALLQIRDSLGAIFPLNWSTDIPISEWNGIQRFSDSGVEHLLLRDRDLTGIIPAEFGRLLALDTLNLSDNRLHGEIPSELGDLMSLRGLYLNNNELEGGIPAELGNLTGLRELYLSHNRIEACMPLKIFETVDRVTYDDHLEPCED